MKPGNEQDDEYRQRVQREVENLADGLTRVLFGDYDTVLRAASADPLFGNLAMLGNVVINSARNAIADQSRLAEEAQRHASAVEEHRLRLHTILESTQDGVAFFDDRDVLIFHSAMFAEITGLAPDLLRSRSAAELVKELQATGPRPSTGFDGPFQTTKERVFSLVRIERPEARSLRVYGGPVIGQEPGMNGRIVVLRDVTAFDHARIYRDELVGNLAHEIRTPLTSIQGFAEMLEKGQLGQLNADQMRVLQVVQHNARRLANLVDDLLNVDRLESGRVQHVRLEVGALLSEIVESMQASARAKNIGLDLSLAEGPLLILGDMRTLGQALRNLISNAIKYTFSGRVTIRAEALADGRTEIRVSDTGIGMSRDTLLRIFDRYYRADDPRVRGVAGTGLGLAIVHRFIQLNRGEISVESEMGRGSTFRLLFPPIPVAQTHAQ